jgi:hypothetical protein
MESNRAAVSSRYSKNVRQATLAGDRTHVSTKVGSGDVCVMVPPNWISIAFDVAALAGAILRTGGLDPAFALARILPFATVLRALAGTLTLAAIRPDTFHAGLILLAAGVLRQYRLRREHQPDRRRQHGSAHFNLVHLYSSE